MYLCMCVCNVVKQKITKEIGKILRQLGKQEEN